MQGMDVDLVSLDRRLSAILGQDYNAESMDVDLRSLDKRVEEAEVAPPIDYRTGSIDYSKAFQDMYDCEIFIDADGRFLLKGDFGVGDHGLLSLRMYIPEQFLKILCEFNPPEFTNGWREPIFEGAAFECMSCFVWDPSRDFIGQSLQTQDSEYITLTDSFFVNRPINVPPELIQSFFGYAGFDDLTFDKKVRVAVPKLDESTDLLVWSLRLAGYNKQDRISGGYSANNCPESTYSFSEEYKPCKIVTFTPGCGLGYLFDGILSPFGNMMIDTTNPFDSKSWKFDGTDGILLQGVPGQPLEGEFADKIPPEWHDL